MPRRRCFGPHENPIRIDGHARFNRQTPTSIEQQDCPLRPGGFDNDPHPPKQNWSTNAVSLDLLK
jgi:hypothetical protein